MEKFLENFRETRDLVQSQDQLSVSLINTSDLVRDSNPYRQRISISNRLKKEFPEYSYTTP